MCSGIYRFNIDYDVVASYSLQALEGYAPGWCYPVLVSQTPLIYELYVERWEEKPEVNPGKKIGSFELRRRPHGECEIMFSEVPFPTRRPWSDDEKRELKGLSKDEMRERLLAIDEKINVEAEAEYERLKKHFDEVVKVYFRRLQDWDITPNKDMPAVQASVEKIEKPKQKGRYRLTAHDIEFRRQKVKEAMKIKKDNPQKQWKEIDKQFADELKISDRTFRSWRHNNY